MLAGRFTYKVNVIGKY